MKSPSLFNVTFRSLEKTAEVQIKKVFVFNLVSNYAAKKWELKKMNSAHYLKVVL